MARRLLGPLLLDPASPDWKRQRASPCARGVAYFTPCRHGRLMPFVASRGERLSITISQLFRWFLKHAEFPFQCMLLWRLSEMSGPVTCHAGESITSSQSRVKKKMISLTNGDSKGRESGPVGVCFVSLFSFLYALRKLFEGTCISEGGAEEPPGTFEW